MSKRSTFLRADTSTKLHLKIVITDPDPDNMVLVVSVSTIYKGVFHDSSCELVPGDHSFIKQPSFVAYQYTTALDAVNILKEKFKGLIIQKEDVSSELLSRIQSGAQLSKFLPLHFKKYFSFF
jgi:hypothetical protein